MFVVREKRGTVMGDSVHHPVHYGGESNSHECIKCLEAWLTPEQFQGWLLGNTLKYLNRAGKKGDLLEDLKKAAWYLNRLIETITKENGNG